jgi:hypothetical protein
MPIIVKELNTTQLAQTVPPIKITGKYIWACVYKGKSKQIADIRQ